MARLGACEDASWILEGHSNLPADWMNEALETKEEHRSYGVQLATVLAAALQRWKPAVLQARKAVC